ncbi:MAG: aldose epimerase family protein [Centipeda sp. (in: firmicutes)]|uniref:aldose epimerase family protein n=1 Tax=Selenomonas sp. oral taxon 920 TaxID=1884263 RepID=UPI000840CA5A|nr:aldose epimerase family protein [Selenomonas sp. oral taxon 920]AOH47109.1 galactose mutarotase [Selenomonas sp. oral taxon 920]
MTELKMAPFGTMPGGDRIELYTLTNARGTRAAITTYGARLVSFERLVDGKPLDIVLGYDCGEDYVADRACMGAIVGRHANRIAGGRVTIAGHPYQLELNTGSKKQNHIHGGSKGLHYHLWTAEIAGGGAAFTTVSPDGEGGYPGNFKVRVTYRLTDDDALIISYRAVSDADTICNLTNHTYFNLEGATADTVLDHTAEIYADAFTWADAESLPDGRILPVVGTPMDFTEPHRIGERIDADYDQLRMAGGYDHNWVLRGDFAPEPYSHLKKAARITSKKSGLALSCYTTQIGMQFYTGNFLGKTPVVGKGGKEFARRSGFCLETQFFPNAPANPHFPQPLLKMDEVWEAETVYHLEDL